MIYYVALPFTATEGGLAPGQAVECPNGAAAIRRAAASSANAAASSANQANARAVAFSRSGDPNLGEFDDAVILKTFGQVPDDFAESPTA
jgi:hypothetical protein